MGIGKQSDFKIYEPQFQAGMIEVYAQNLNVFNAASGNTLLMGSDRIKGNFETQAYWKSLSNLITRRDLTSVSALTDIAMVQDEFSSVKVNRTFGPIAQTLNSFQKIGSTPEVMSMIVGRWYAEHKMRDMVNTAISIAETAIQGQSAANYVVPSGGTLDYVSMVKGLAKFGDAGDRIVAWVMHSKPFYDLMGDSITQKIFGVANVTIYQGTIGSLGRPIIVTDSPALFTDVASTDTYHTLGLTVGAATVKESENDLVVSEVITGLAQLVARIQGEYAFNAEVKGYTWDIANGGANPTDSALATTTNWDLKMADIKNSAGIRITST